MLTGMTVLDDEEDDFRGVGHVGARGFFVDGAGC